MLDRMFMQILSMSLTASYVILFIILARVVLRKAPKIFSYALWSVALFRLICPWSFESVLSLLSFGDRATEQLRPLMIQQLPVSAVRSGTVLNSGIITSSGISGATSIPLAVNAFTLLWLVGVVTLLIYSLVMYIKLQRRLKGAIFDKNNIYLSRNLSTPFVMGVIHPKIYLPEFITGTEKEYILLHEQTHIHRRDHVIKLLGFFVLCMHWFNPLVWVAFFLSGKDMEMSCDETVIKKMGNDVKKAYSASLLSLSIGRGIIGGSPLAFGEGNTRGRIKNVLGYKKPAFWVIATVLVAVIALCIGLAANPESQASVNGKVYRVKEILYEVPQYNFGYTIDTAPRYYISDDKLYRREKSEKTWTLMGDMYQYPLTKQERQYYSLLNDSAKVNMDQVNKVYRVVVDDEIKTIFLVMQQRNGDLLLAHGYDNPGSPQVRWLFMLERSDDNDDMSKVDSPKVNDSPVTIIPATEGGGEQKLFSKVDPLEAAVSKAVLEQNTSGKSYDGFAAESHIILGKYGMDTKKVSNSDTVTVYAMALYMEFSFEENGIKESGGSHIPVAITFNVEENDTYKLKEYWVPQDGTYYEPSIRDKFPIEIVEDAMDTQKYIWAQSIACYEQAIAYKKLDMSGEIKELLKIICSTPAQMSNPKEYINEHPIEYRTLVYYGNSTLDYCFNLFKQGGQTGLEGHIMASICQDILLAKGIVFEDIQYNTGQDWYDGIKDTLKR